MPHHSKLQWTHFMEVLRLSARRGCTCLQLKCWMHEQFGAWYSSMHRCDPTASRCEWDALPGLSSFRNVLDSISAGMEEERQALQQERQTLDRRRKEFEDEQAVVAQVLANFSCTGTALYR